MVAGAAKQGRGPAGSAAEKPSRKEAIGDRGLPVWSDKGRGLFCDSDRPTSFPCRRE
jgi:hypothetical protein